MHNNIMVAGSRDRPPMLTMRGYAQWQSRFMRYIDTRPNDEALKKCILQRPYKLSHIIILEWSRFVTIIKKTINLDKELYHKLFDILKQYQKEVNKICAEKIAKNANPLTLVAAAQQYPDAYYQAPKPHKSYAPPSKQSSSTRSQVSTRHKGKEIAKTITPLSESASKEENDLEQAQRDKDVQNNLALIAKYFKKIYKPTNNNLRTSSNFINKNVDTSPRYKNDKQTRQFRNQRTMTVAGTRETIGSQVVQQTGIQCFNFKKFRHFAKERKKPKRPKDYTYHKEMMLLCKQAEKGVPLKAGHDDWLEDTDEEINEQELEAHYSFMKKIREVLPVESRSNVEPLEKIEVLIVRGIFLRDKMSRDVLTIGSTMRIPLFYRGEYSQWVERFMNYLEEQTDGEAMINSIKNGDQPLPRVTQKQYATMMRQNKNLMDINIDALYNIGSKKKTVVVTSYPLAFIVEKTTVSRSKEKVVVSSDSEGSEADDFYELKKIIDLLAKALIEESFYSKPTNNNLRTSSTSQSANKKQEFVQNDNKKVEKKDDEKKRVMSRVKCYNCKKEGHFAKDYKKVKVKDYEYYKTKMLLTKKDKDEQLLWIFVQEKMSRDVLTVGYTMRIPLLYRVSIAGTSSTKQPLLKDKSMWSDQEKKIQKIDHLARSLLIQGLLNDIYSLIDSNKTVKDLWDALARHMLGSEYGEQDMKAAVLYEYETFKATEGEFVETQNQGDVNDAMGLKKKTVMVTSDPLALIAKKMKKVLSDSEASSLSVDDKISEVQRVRADNGTEFKNKTLAKFFDEDVGKLKAKGDIGVFVGYSKESDALEIYNNRTRKIHESVNVNFDEILEMASKQFSLEPGLSNLNETGKSLNPKSSATNVESSNVEVSSHKEEVFHESSESFQEESFSSSLNNDVQQSSEEVGVPSSNTQSVLNNMVPNVDEASTSHNVFNEHLDDAYFDVSISFHDPSNVHTFYQPYPHEKKWTKDHPLYKIIDDQKSCVRTRGTTSKFIAFDCNNARNAMCNARMNASVDVNDLFVFDDESIRKSHVSKMPFRKKPRDSLNVRSNNNSSKYLLRAVHRWLPKIQPLAEPIAKWIPKVKHCLDLSLDYRFGMSKHMTGNHALLTNFMEKFLGMVRFGNNDFEVIVGYGDVVIGSMMIKKVYYVE
nr:integrase, catalytic region, zinc finger, CCHC-type, peptidase aspartic, catalytic [Tanacetum cinerariifolium]